MWRALLILFTAVFAFGQQPGDYSVEKLLGGFQYASAVAWHQERSGENFLLIADCPEERSPELIQKARLCSPKAFMRAASRRIRTAGFTFAILIRGR